MKTIKTLIALTGAGVLLVGPPAWSQSLVETARGLKLNAVTKLQLASCDSMCVAELTVSLQNSNESALWLRDSDYQVVIESGTNKIDVGVGHIKELEIPGVKGSKNTAEAQVQVVIGPKGNPMTFETVTKLLNVVGNPAAPIVVVLRGSSNVGFQIAGDPGSRIYPQDGRFDGELRLRPTLARSALFE